MLAAVSVLVAFFFGNVLREFNHRRWGRKAFAALAGAGYLVCLAIYILLVDHYRDALLANPDTATAEAVLRLLHTPLAIFDFNTLLLMLASVGFAAAAATAGYNSSDPYPGYEAADRRYVPFRRRLTGLVNRFCCEVAVLEQLPGQVDARRSTRPSHAIGRSTRQCATPLRRSTSTTRSSPSTPRIWASTNTAWPRPVTSPRPSRCSPKNSRTGPMGSAAIFRRCALMGEAGEFVGHILGVPAAAEATLLGPSGNGDGTADGATGQVVSYCPSAAGGRLALAPGVNTTAQ